LILSPQRAVVEQESSVRQLAQLAPLSLVAGFAIGAAGAVFFLMWRRPPSPAVRERRRRLDVNARGHMVDATVTDFRGDDLHYSYTVRGVQYAAAQDISAVRDRLPADAGTLIGAATVKYSPRNPANSIVVCEEWSGLRDNRAVPREPGNGERSLP
jgi:hypothetical protein